MPKTATGELRKRKRLIERLSLVVPYFRYELNRIETILEKHDHAQSDLEAAANATSERLATKEKQEQAEDKRVLIPKDLKRSNKGRGGYPVKEI